MKTRAMTMLAGAGIAAALLAGCGQSDDSGETTAPSPSPTSESTTPTAGASETTPSAPQSAEDLVGAWRSEEADWTVRFEADGTFTEDFEGIEDFRTGEYEFEDGVVTLIGGDGNSSDGEVDGQSLVFRLGTLTRQ